MLRSEIKTFTTVFTVTETCCRLRTNAIRVNSLFGAKHWTLRQINRPLIEEHYALALGVAKHTNHRPSPLPRRDRRIPAARPHEARDACRCPARALACRAACSHTQDS